MQVELRQPRQPVQRAWQDLCEEVMGQIDALQVVWHVGGDSPEAVVAEVEGLEARQCVVDEDHLLQLIV